MDIKFNFNFGQVILIVAEVELQAASEQVSVPDWVSSEVTGDARYYNVNLSKKPFSSWG